MTNINVTARNPANRTLNTTTRPFLKWLALCASTALVACAGINATSPEDVVKQRVNERWKALVSGDFARSYSYTSPSFRGLISR